MIAIATTDQEVERCFPVMVQLRPLLKSASDLVARVRVQEREGYQLAYAEDEGVVRAVAGYRIIESLSAGRHVYVDDLVTDEQQRSQGYGGRLFDWLIAYARENSCMGLALDSGVHRFDAHRFYLQKRMNITSHHFHLDFE